MNENTTSEINIRNHDVRTSVAIHVLQTLGDSLNVGPARPSETTPGQYEVPIYSVYNVNEKVGTVVVTRKETGDGPIDRFAMDTAEISRRTTEMARAWRRKRLTRSAAWKACLLLPWLCMGALVAGNFWTVPLPTEQDTVIYFEPGLKNFGQKVTDNYNAAHPGARLFPEFVASRTGFKDIYYKRYPDRLPVIWNPADSYWIDLLNETKKREAQPFEKVAGSSYFSTKIVFVLDKEHGKVFQDALKVGEYADRPWHLLHDLAKNGWHLLGKSEWGDFRLAQSSVVDSNSGFTAMALAFREFREEQKKQFQKEITVDSDDFVAFMKEIEEAAKGNFFDTTSLTLKDGLIPYIKNRNGNLPRYDLAICYEANAIQELNRGQKDIYVCYPSRNYKVDYPFAILNEKWVTSEKKATAERFINAIRSSTSARAVLEEGFHPDKMNDEFAKSYEKYVEFGIQPHALDGQKRRCGYSTDDEEFKGLKSLVEQWHRAVVH